MNRDLFRSRSLALRPGETQDVAHDRMNGDELRAMIHSLQNVMPRKVLVVEPDQFYVDVVNAAMTEGMVTVVETWQAGLKYLSDDLYDLVLLSVEREGPLDTLDLLRYQRATVDAKNFLTPFIGMIAEGNERRKPDALRWGCISALQKPFTALMLRATILEQFNTAPAMWQGEHHS